MLNINDDTVMIGATELRSEMPKLAKMLKIKKVIVMKRGKPLAILEDFSKYEEKEEIIDLFEDLVLGHLAKERDSIASDKDFIDHDELKKKLGF